MHAVLIAEILSSWVSSGIYSCIISEFGCNIRAIDFRLLILKDQYGKWQDIGMIARLILQQRIISICRYTCLFLDDAMGNYGDLGFDVMIDADRNIWIIEINKTHDHRFPIYSINDYQMYSKVICKPMQYAKALAGFAHNSIKGELFQ